MDTTTGTTMTEAERLAKIAELLPGPCPEPGIADGMDMCVCRSGEVWPCSATQAVWLARGISMEDEMRKVRDAVSLAMAIEQAQYETILAEQGDAAARNWAMKKLGW